MSAKLVFISFFNELLCWLINTAVASLRNTKEPRSRGFFF